MVYVVEYVWLDAVNMFRSKTRVLSDPIANITILDIPVWNYDGSSTEQAVGNDSEVLLVPVYMVTDPFSTDIREGLNAHERRNGYRIVLCETQDRHGKPLPNNHRGWAKSAFDKNLKLHPWYGLEQEYFILHLPHSKFKPYWTPGGLHYCGVGLYNTIERKLANAHLEACVAAHLTISGINAEVAPGQWEFQIGPVEGINAGDQLLMARYLLVRIAETMEIQISFHPKIDKEQNGSGCHCNFSTLPMRNEGGLTVINDAIEKLGTVHNMHMNHYGQDNNKRMTGKNETATFDTFTHGRANRGASVRIPNDTVEKGCGYFEDRRPASNCDPYLVTGLVFSTTCLDPADQTDPCS
jgi:glutamine synthetase